jgi:hypothetical protein
MLNQAHKVISTDLETTGTNEEDEITAGGFAVEQDSSDWLNMDMVFYIVVNQNDRCDSIDSNKLEDSIERHADVRNADVRLIECDTESELIDNINRVIDGIDTNKLVGYNYYSQAGSSFDYNKLADATNRMQLTTGRRVNHPLRGYEIMDLYDTCVKYGDIGTRSYESVSVDALYSTYNKAGFKQFARRLEEQVDVDTKVSDWDSGSTKGETRDKLEQVEQIFDDDEVLDVVSELLESDGKDMPSETATGLDEVYDLKRVRYGDDDEVYEIDPLEGDSGKCVEEYEQGNMENVVLHLAQDLIMTQTVYNICMTQTPQDQIRFNRV